MSMIAKSQKLREKHGAPCPSETALLVSRLRLPEWGEFWLTSPRLWYFLILPWETDIDVKERKKRKGYAPSVLISLFSIYASPQMSLCIGFTTWHYFFFSSKPNRIFCSSSCAIHRLPTPTLLLFACRQLSDSVLFVENSTTHPTYTVFYSYLLNS